MKSRAIRAALLLVSLLPAGCGTVSNLVECQPQCGKKVPFGGVQQDMRCLNKALDGEAAARGKADADLYPQHMLMLLSAVDLPFSFVGDIVTWPYTAAYTFINRPIPVPAVLQAPTVVAVAPPPVAAATTPPATPATQPTAPAMPPVTPVTPPKASAMPPVAAVLPPAAPATSPLVTLPPSVSIPPVMTLPPESPPPVKRQ